MQEKEIKSIQIQKEEIKLFADEIISSSENTKESTKKVLKLICKFSKVTGYAKINYFYILAMNTEIENTVSFKIPKKNNNNKV